jgi:hypothetical protein
MLAELAVDAGGDFRGDRAPACADGFAAAAEKSAYRERGHFRIDLPAAQLDAPAGNAPSSIDASASRWSGLRPLQKSPALSI